MTLKRSWMVVLVLGLMAGCGWMKELKMPVVTFFESIKSGDIQGAYGQTSAAFQASTDFARFQQFLKGTGLDKYDSGSWPSVSFENETGKVEGTVTTSDGQVIPLTVHLVRFETQWQIQRIETETAGVSETTEDQNPLVSAAAEAGIPEATVLAQMTTEAVSRLGTAITQENYTDFHNWISDTWRQQVEPAQLQQAFHVFKEHDIDLTMVQGVSPVFNPEPTIDSDGLLRLKGSFDTTPYKVFFELSYVNEEGQWRLFGISVNLE